VHSRAKSKPARYERADVEVLLAEVSGTTLRLVHRPPRRRGRSLSASASRDSSTNTASATRWSFVPGCRSPRSLSLSTTAGFLAAVHARVRLRDAREGHRSVTGEPRRRFGPGGHDRRRRRRRHDPLRTDCPLEPDSWRLTMSREILEPCAALPPRRTSTSEKLMEALEDALLSPTRRRHGAGSATRRSRWARESGDFKGLGAEDPAGASRSSCWLRRPQSSSRRSIPKPARCASRPSPRSTSRSSSSSRIRSNTEDVHGPHDFGRIAAQTAKQGDSAADPRSRARHDVRGVTATELAS